MDQKRGKSKIWFALFLVFLIIVVFAAGMLFKQFMDSRAANAQLDSLQSDVNGTAGSNTAETIEGQTKEDDGIDEEEGGLKADAERTSDPLEELGIEIPEKNLDWDALHEENGDIYAWIYVPDTGVDYPVLQHPTDNSYYLDYNIDGTKGYPGCIYTEDFNRKDFSDIHTVVYGHTLKDKTMFSTLHNFEDDDLFDKEHYIFIYTEDYIFVYRIFAAYEFGAIHLLDNFDYTNEYVYEDYLKKIYRTADRVANVKADIEVTTQDQIMTLSTCTDDHDADRRFLVTGVLVNPREQGR